MRVEERKWGEWVFRKVDGVREVEIKRIYRNNEGLFLQGQRMRFGGGGWRRFDDAWLLDGPQQVVLGEAKARLAGDQHRGTPDGEGRRNSLARKLAVGLPQWHRSAGEAIRLVASREDEPRVKTSLAERVARYPGSPTWNQVWEMAKKPHLLVICGGLTRTAERTLPSLLEAHRDQLTSAMVLVFQPLDSRGHWGFGSWKAF